MRRSSIFRKDIVKEANLPKDDEFYESLIQNIDKSERLDKQQKMNIKQNLNDEIKAINSVFSVKKGKEDERMIQCNYDLNLKPINQTLNKYAAENDYRQIKVQKNITLRGGKSISYKIKLEDQTQKIVKRVLQVKSKKEEIQKYCNRVINTNTTVQMLSDQQLSELQTFQRDIGSLMKDMLVYEELNKIKKQKAENQLQPQILLDVAFVIDATGSMSSLYSAAQKKCQQIASQLAFQDKAIDIKYAFVAYRDHIPQLQEDNKADDEPIHKVVDFNSFDEIYKQIAATTCTDGDDTPQAIHDGLMKAATDLNWRQNSHRYVFLIADAPPHGSEYSSCSDNYPNGCPCNIKLDDIVMKFKEMKISLIFCTVDGGKTYNTDDVFKSKFPKNSYSTNKINKQNFGFLVSVQIKDRYQKYKQILTNFNKLVKQIEIKRIENALSLAFTLCQEQADIQRRMQLNRAYDTYKTQLEGISNELVDLKNKLQIDLKQAKQANEIVLGKADTLNKKIIKMKAHKEQLVVLNQFLSGFFNQWENTSSVEQSTQIAADETG